MDTMELTKITGALCGALLVFLLVNWASGAIYAPGGGHGGSVEAAYVIDVEEEAPIAADAEGIDFAALVANADPDRGKRVFAKCKACHKLEDGANTTGPSLFAIVNRSVATVPGFSYSGALENLGGVWSYDRLDHFLAKPTAYAPGTKMSFAGLKKPADRANLIAYLETIGN
ncbi:MAG: cytochrome c family protein [Paracoccaceae bacterium]|nr:cytochrome c family protein [Paracoccaceae bacterium]MDE2911918.1 cytochrome c family protein [Paracoccaceae bacterium]